MGLSLEFFLDDGQVITYDSLSNPSSNDCDAIGMLHQVDCSDMNNGGVVVDTWIVRAGTEPEHVGEGKVVVGPDDMRHTYKVLQNNRDFMVMGEEGYLLNPTETQMYLDDVAASAAIGPDDEHYAEIIAEQAARQSSEDSGGVSTEDLSPDSEFDIDPETGEIMEPETGDDLTAIDESSLF